MDFRVELIFVILKVIFVSKLPNYHLFNFPPYTNQHIISGEKSNKKIFICLD